MGRLWRRHADGVEPEPVKTEPVDHGDRPAITVGDTHVDLETAAALELASGDDVYPGRPSRFPEDPTTLEPDRQVDPVGSITRNQGQIGVETCIEKSGMDHVAAIVDVGRKRDGCHDLAPAPAHVTEGSEGRTVVEPESAQVGIEAVGPDPTPRTWSVPPLPAWLGRDVVSHPTDEPAEMGSRRMSVVDADNLERNAIRGPRRDRDPNPPAVAEGEGLVVHDVLERKARDA